MLMKIGSKDNDKAPNGIGSWSTGLSWYDEGSIYPITATVFYSTPHFEVIDVRLDFDKKNVEIPPRLTSYIAASAIEEYIQAAQGMRQKDEQEQKRARLVDPLFEE
jgi:ABC-type taurine transport system substrate-binding protein